MDPEIWVAVAAVFVSGGAIGTAGTLLTQWIVRGLRDPGPPRGAVDPRDMARLRTDLATLVRKVRNMDERLDFQEQLLGGASPTRSPPRRLADPEPSPSEEGSEPDRRLEAAPDPRSPSATDPAPHDRRGGTDDGPPGGERDPREGVRDPR